MFARTRITIGALSLCAIVSTLVLVGCDSTQTDAPDPTAANTHPGTHQAVIKEPDGFRNVAFSCNGTTGVYVTSHSATDSLPSGIAVLANDPACAG